MASELIAHLVTEEGRSPVPRQVGEQSFVGRRIYRVNTENEEKAVEALGIPLWGEAWSSSRPLLRVVDIEPRFIGGDNDGTTETGGYCEVEVSYATDDGTGAPLPYAGLAYTEIDTETTSVNLRMDIRGPDATVNAGTFDKNIPIEDGRGVTRDVGGIVYRVVVFPTANAQAPLGTVKSMQIDKVVNENELTLPPLLRTTFRPVIPAGHAQYMDFQVGREGQTGFIKMVHVIRETTAAAPDVADPDATAHPAAYYFWRGEDSKGRPVGPLRASKRYKTMEWPDSLWPVV